MKKYRLTVTEEQLRLISACVEDCHRFMAGQTELNNMRIILEENQELYDKLKELQPLVTPNLPLCSYYGWSGGSCQNKFQRKFIAQTYAIYREILHRLWVINHPGNSGAWCVYDGDTLTCEEGGELPIIELIEE